MKKINYMFVIVPVLLVMVMGSVLVMGSFFDSSERKNTKEENKEPINTSSTLAIMVEQTKDQEDYIEKKLDSFPTTGYIWNKDRSGCVDGDGQKIENSLDYKDGQVSVTADSSAYCFLYFDIQ